MTSLSYKLFLWHNCCTFQYVQRKRNQKRSINFLSYEIYIKSHHRLSLVRAKSQLKIRIYLYVIEGRCNSMHPITRLGSRWKSRKRFPDFRAEGPNPRESDLASLPTSTILGTEAVYVGRKRRRGAASNLSSYRRPWTNHWPRSPRPPPRSAEYSHAAVVLSDPPDSTDVSLHLFSLNPTTLSPLVARRSR